jgi:hypothetical protein
LSELSWRSGFEFPVAPLENRITVASCHPQAVKAATMHVNGLGTLWKESWDVAAVGECDALVCGTILGQSTRAALRMSNADVPILSIVLWFVIALPEMSISQHIVENMFATSSIVAITTAGWHWQQNTLYHHARHYNRRRG